MPTLKNWCSRRVSRGAGPGTRLAEWVLIFALLSAGIDAQATAPDPGAYWEYRHWHGEISGRRVTTRTHRKLVVTGPRGDDYAIASFMENSLHKLARVRVIVRGADGSEIRALTKRDLEKHCGYGPSYQIYSDDCFYLYRPAVPTYPYSVEYESEEICKTRFFVRGAEIATSLPVQAATCSLICDTDIPIRYRTPGLAGDLVDTVDRDRVIAFAFEDIPSIDEDTVVLRDLESAGWVCFAVDDVDFAGASYSDGSWSAIASWYADVSRKLYDARPAVSHAGEGERADPVAAAREIYDRVRLECRYVAVQIGTGGWRSRRASDVEKTKYGDCKDLATLVVSRLRSAGIEAYPALILTRGYGYLDPKFPEPRFNHVIAAAVLGSDTVWMDPTCSHCPYSLLPWGDQFTHALIASAADGKLVATPASSAEANKRVRRTRLHLKPDLYLEVRSEVTVDGLPAVFLRSSLSHMSRSERLEFAASMFEDGAQAWRVGQFDIDNLEDPYQPLVLRVEAESTRPMRKIGRTAYVDACVLDLDFRYSDGLADRVRPIRLRYPWMIVDSVRLVIDSAINIDSIGATAAYQTEVDFARFESSGSSENREIALASQVAFTAQEILPGDFTTLIEFEEATTGRDHHLVRVYLGR